MNIQSRFHLSAGILAAALFVGTSCAQGQPLTVLPAVGPDSGTKANATGYLVVYTDTESPIGLADIQYYPHTGYKIYDGRGVLVRSVRNHSSERDETPARVGLAPGHYTVVGRFESKGEVAVPIVVSTSRTTVVNLEKRSHEG